MPFQPRLSPPPRITQMPSPPSTGRFRSSCSDMTSSVAGMILPGRFPGRVTFGSAVAPPPVRPLHPIDPGSPRGDLRRRATPGGAMRKPVLFYAGVLLAALASAAPARAVTGVAFVHGTGRQTDALND